MCFSLAAPKSVEEEILRLAPNASDVRIAIHRNGRWSAIADYEPGEGESFAPDPSGSWTSEYEISHNGMVIKKIEEIAAEVEVEWKASDGGGTWASGDVLYTARWAVKCIKESNSREIWELDPCNSSTGAEAEIIDIAQQWAVNEIKRQIEDRLKDEKFFEQVINLL